MALKTFNLNEEIYKEYSELSKKHGFSMSKKIENFIKEDLGRMKNPVEKKIIDRETKTNLKDHHPMGRYC